MTVKLHRCPNLWLKVGAHPCWRVQKALDEQNVEYEIVKGPLRPGKRDEIARLTGQRQYPVVQFDDGSVYREQSKAMAAMIRAGKLDEKRGAERPAPAATLKPARGYSSAGRAPGSHPGGRRFESG